MLKLSNLSIEIADHELGTMVESLTIFESIKGSIKGSFAIQDNINFYDTFIGHVQPIIDISFTYLNSECSNSFMGDGISKMNITKTGKSYIVHFHSIQSADLKLKNINHAYSGMSHEVILGIWKESVHEDSLLVIDNEAATNGKYVVPNISAGIAISNVLDCACDNESSGFYLYQRLFDQGVTRLTSINGMKKHFKLGSNKNYVISNNIVSLDLEQSNIGTIGTSNSFILEEFSRNFTNKVADGNYGNKIHQVEIDETKTKKNEAIEITNNQITKFKLSSQLYENGVVSIFSTANDPIVLAAKNEKKRMFNQYLNVLNVVAVPNIGVGQSVEIATGGSDKSSSRQDTNYIIANINHKFVIDDGKFSYAQDMGLVRR
jgi:hypothetical protein|tara:strand:- start:596 stop:1723 length:1128 start_codon:yes stop_codon:yes gene_type:complete